MKKGRIFLGVLLLIVVITAWNIFWGHKNFYMSKNLVNLDTLKTKQIIPWGIKSIKASTLWSKATGKGVKVAIMDSGIDFKHPDFGKNIKEGYNAIDPMQLPKDNLGHGTLVSGVIAAQNNEFGIVGIAPDVELYPIKVLDNFGEGEISAIANGVEWCIKNKIQIINMSFAIPKDTPLLRNTITKAVDAGIIVVASANNSYCGEAGYPASYIKVISVTAVDNRFRICKTAPRGKIDFSAPGVGIVSTSSNGGYEELLGTSLAAPHITGLIALILQDPQKFGLSENNVNLPDDIYNILKSLSKDLGEKGKDRIFGEGFVAL
ncbi:MAG: S8 family peptidase [Clostridia bacterium]|nr:S8 family peptidase [Clostridia bacterium]